MTTADWKPLMLIYNTGFIAVYLIFALLYWHAYSKRDELELSPMERYETRGVVQENVLMMSVGVIAMILALINLPQLSGPAYVLIGPLQTALGFMHGKKRRELEAASAA